MLTRFQDERCYEREKWRQLKSYIYIRVCVSAYLSLYFCVCGFFFFLVWLPVCMSVEKIN